MIYFDVTRTGTASHRSGLTRVSARLRKELGEGARSVVWKEGKWRFAEGSDVVDLSATDWLLTPELFCEAERPGWWGFLRAKPCRLAAIFHDAIPLKLPHITWPQSVSRHPEYMKMLAAFDRIFAVSDFSRRELVGFWRWQGVSTVATVDVLALGADLPGHDRVVRSEPGEKTSLLCVGILEPRKNQGFLLDVCEALWREGELFDLHLVGRVNPHFGRPLAERIERLSRVHKGLKYHRAADDRCVAQLYRDAAATVFPTIAEGCGLPLLESLWLGTPCVCSDLPVLRENAAGGACALVPLNDLAAWRQALRRVLKDAAWRNDLRGQAMTRELPTWAAAAATLRSALG
jgi:glycosyltransferase involved in cell wall biosynthesis